MLLSCSCLTHFGMVGQLVLCFSRVLFSRQSAVVVYGAVSFAMALQTVEYQFEIQGDPENVPKLNKVTIWQLFYFSYFVCWLLCGIYITHHLGLLLFFCFGHCWVEEVGWSRWKQERESCFVDQKCTHWWMEGTLCWCCFATYKFRYVQKICWLVPGPRPCDLRSKVLHCPKMSVYISMTWTSATSFARMDLIETGTSFKWTNVRRLDSRLGFRRSPSTPGT